MRNSIRSFPVGIIEELGGYVYRYVDPRTDETFYIGKGGGEWGNHRVFAHLNEAEDLKKFSAKVEKIREIWAQELDIQIIIHRHGMNAEEAHHVEAALIELFPDAHNEVEGKDTFSKGARLVDDLINEKSRARAEINFPAVCINIRQEWLRIRPSRTAPVDERQLYLSTRTAWPVQPKRHASVEYAISTAFGLVRQVYQIECWRRAILNSDGTSRPRDDRWMFEGKVASDKGYLIGQSIDHLQKPGAQNAIRWWYPNGKSKASPLVSIYED